MEKKKFRKENGNTDSLQNAKSFFRKSRTCPFSGADAIPIDYKDIKSNALKFLENEGNPYHFIGVDENGKIGLEFGVFGLPETFLTNNKGEIVFKHTGPLTLKIIQNEIITRLQ